VVAGSARRRWRKLEGFPTTGPVTRKAQIDPGGPAQLTPRPDRPPSVSAALWPVLLTHRWRHTQHHRENNKTRSRRRPNEHIGSPRERTRSLAAGSSDELRKAAKRRVPGSHLRGADTAAYRETVASKVAESPCSASVWPPVPVVGGLRSTPARGALHHANRHSSSMGDCRVACHRKRAGSAIKDCYLPGISCGAATEARRLAIKRRSAEQAAASDSGPGSIQSRNGESFPDSESLSRACRF
jgi:hypothetical protein